MELKTIAIIGILGFLGLILLGVIGYYLFQRFRPKNKQKIDSQKVDLKDIYRVIIGDRTGSIFKATRMIMAYRWVDSNDNVYLREDGTDDQGRLVPRFLELMPGDSFKVTKLDQPSLKKELNEAKKELKELETYEKQSNERSDKNEEDIFERIAILEAKVKASKYGTSDSSYLFYDVDNIPAFYYVRHEGNFVPFKWDIDTSTIRVSEEAKRKRANLSRVEAKEVFSYKKSKINWVAVAGAVFFILLLGAMIWYNVELIQSNSESDLTKLREENLRLSKEYVELIQNQAEQCYKVNVIDNISNLPPDLSSRAKVTIN